MGRLLKCKRLGNKFRLIDETISWDAVQDMYPLTIRINDGFYNCTRLHMAGKDMIVYATMEDLIAVLEDSDYTSPVIDLDAYYNGYYELEQYDHVVEDDGPPTQGVTEDGYTIYQSESTGAVGILFPGEQGVYDGTGDQSEDKLFEYPMYSWMRYSNFREGMIHKEIQHECSAVGYIIPENDRQKLIILMNDDHWNDQTLVTKIENSLYAYIVNCKIARYRRLQSPFDFTLPGWSSGIPSTSGWEVIIRGKGLDVFKVSMSKYWRNGNTVKWDSLSDDLRTTLDDMDSDKWLLVVNEITQSPHNGTTDSPTSTTREIQTRIRYWCTKDGANGIKSYVKENTGRWDNPNLGSKIQSKIFLKKK